ncbi:MAG: hypothetical protein RLZZ111_1301 [Planctomycetota bacterium]
MPISLDLRRLVEASLATVLLGAALATAQQPSPPAAGQATSQLRWTPHRSATTPDQAASAAPADASAPATSTANPVPATAQNAQARATTTGVAVATSPTKPNTVSTAPASVGLPATVPAVTPPRAAGVPRTAARPTTAGQPTGPRRQQPAGQLGDWKSDNRVPGSFRSTDMSGSLPAMPSLGDVKVFRTPQGEGGRPVLAVEGTPYKPAAKPPEPLGGGLAPRFAPQASGRSPATTAARPAPGRPDRLALNADGLPSVMARAPQAAVLEDGTMPGRLPGAAQSLPAPGGVEPGLTAADPSIVINTAPGEMTDYGLEGFAAGDVVEGYGQQADGGEGGLWMGDYPTQLHVESFYDDPFACEEGPGLLTCGHDGRICAWLRRFGKPYYGWRWYRDFSVGAGITAFQNQSNFGLLGNYGTDQYANWAMPFWNAFGVGWQVGVRGVQSNFQQASVTDALGTFSGRSRQQVFVTTGFFTRAFEGRGLQGGAVYDYLSDSYFENVDVAQIRGEMSYVWGYHELGFWGAFSTLEQQGLFSPSGTSRGVAGTVDLYTAFYRLHFGDANEARIWGGASGDGQGVIGTQIRAPMSRSLALEGMFTYLMPNKSQTVELSPLTSVTYAPSAWNVAVNLVYYPAGRARRSLASPYRPLFDVADNGSMIRSLSRLPTP